MKYYTYDSNLKDRNQFTSTVNTTYGHRRYFSSLDTEVYFGSKQIDEIVAIDFTIAEPKLPIYGYNSYYPNRIVNGRRTVQGTFAINFTNTMYLIDILRNIEDSVMSNDYEAMVFQCPEEDSTGLNIGNSAIFTKRFDITLSYGYGYSSSPSYNGCYQTLVGVQIVDYRQALDTEGNPILDMYSFIAKDIRYETSNNTTNDQTQSGSGGALNGNQTQQNKNTEDSAVPEDLTPITANPDEPEELEKLNTKCTNTERPGFIVQPRLTFSDNNYYLSLSIDPVNNEETKTFKDVDVLVEDQSIGVNFNIAYKSMDIGVKHTELAGSIREDAAKLYKKYSGDITTRPSCVVTFKAVINKTYVTLDCDTTLLIK